MSRLHSLALCIAVINVIKLVHADPQTSHHVIGSDATRVDAHTSNRENDIGVEQDNKQDIFISAETLDNRVIAQSRNSGEARMESASDTRDRRAVVRRLWRFVRSASEQPTDDRADICGELCGDPRMCPPDCRGHIRPPWGRYLLAPAAP